MRDFKRLIACTVFLLHGYNAFAEAIDEDTTCKKAVAETASLDTPTAKEVVTYVLGTMQAIDRLHHVKNQSEILPQMTAEGQALLAFLILNRCSSRGGVSLTDITVETYEAVRARRSSLALTGAPPKLPPKLVAQPSSPASARNRRQASRPSEHRMRVSERAIDQQWTGAPAPRGERVAYSIPSALTFHSSD
jgi:hypothetical protein